MRSASSRKRVIAEYDEVAPPEYQPETWPKANKTSAADFPRASGARLFDFLVANRGQDKRVLL